MSALSQLLPVPVLNQRFATWKALKKNIQDWSVREKFHFEVTHKDKDRVLYQCRDNQYQWGLRGNHMDEGDIQIIILESKHTCIAPLVSRSVASNQEWLQAELPRIMEVTRNTKPKDIVDLIRVQFGEKIDYQVALLARNALATDSLETHRQSFQQLPGFLHAIQETNPNTYTDLMLINTNRFHRLFICPTVSRTSFTFCRKFVAIDGTFLKGRFIQTLLLATTIDANHNILLLAWAIVESENIESWSYFLRHLMLVIPEILTQDPPTTLMTDRDKGLSIALATYGLQILPAHCCFHFVTVLTRPNRPIARYRALKHAIGR